MRSGIVPERWDRKKYLWERALVLVANQILCGSRQQINRVSKPIKIVKLLVYYDLPQVFLGEDEAGQRYMGLLVEEEKEAIYLVVAISERRFEAYTGKEIDLRSVFEEPETKEWLLARSGTSVWLETQHLAVEEVGEDLLPEAGFFSYIG